MAWAPPADEAVADGDWKPPADEAVFTPPADEAIPPAEEIGKDGSGGEAAQLSPTQLAGTALTKAGQLAKRTVGAYIFEGMAEPELQEQELTAPEGQTPIEEGERALPTAGRVLSKAAYGLVDSAPRLAGTVAAQAAGVPAPIAAAAMFGTGEEGFDPKQAAIAAALPYVGKYAGEVAGSLAKSYGVTGTQAVNAIKAAGGMTGAAGLLAAQDVARIQGLPEEQRKDAYVDAVANVVGQSLLGPMGVEFESAEGGGSAEDGAGSAEWKAPEDEAVPEATAAPASEAAWTPPEDEAVGGDTTLPNEGAANVPPASDAGDAGGEDIAPGPFAEAIAQEKAANAPAASAEPAAPTKTGAWLKWFPRSDGVPDVLDAIAEEGGIQTPSQSKFAGKGEYDGYNDAFSKGMAARLRRSDGGQPPDLLMQALKEHGFDFATPDEMYDAVSAAAKERQNLKGTQGSEAAQLAQQQEQTQQFEQAALNNRGRPEAERVAADAVPAKQMAVGDSFTLNGEPFTVSHYDATSDVYTVDDGKVFGRQYLNGEKDFFPDAGSVRGADPDWTVDETKAHAADLVQEQRVQRMAASSAAQAARAPRPGPTPPAPRAAPMPPSRTGFTALPAPKHGPLRDYFERLARPIRDLTAPQTIDAHARRLANIVRENGGKSALDLARADDAMAEYKRDFDRTPVAKGWQYDPAQPLPRNYQFMADAESNRAALSPAHQDFVKLFDQLFQGRIAEVRRLAPKAMQQLIQDYFPHVWKDPKAAARFTNEWAAKAPLHGDKSFLKERSLPYVLDGLKRGLEPISDNPADLLLMKLHQMDKFILAERTLQEAKAIGLRKYLPVFQAVPDGWKIVNDRSSTVNGPPVVTVQEAFDAQIRKGLLDFAAKMGFSHERVASLGANAWGQYTTGAGKIETKFGGPDFVIAHEIGHGLDDKYGLGKVLTATHQMQSELNRLSALRSQGQPTSAAFKKYALTPPEQMATVLQAYLHAPELMQQKAPAVKAAFEQFIQQHPELHDLNAIKPSLALGASKSEIPLPGYTVMGHYIMPEGAAQVLTNYLSPGLSRFAAYRTFRAATNIMNAAQLGLSAFHLGFTSLDATVSAAAVGLQKLSTLDPYRMMEGAKRIATSPTAPVTNYYLGKAVQEAMLHPGSNSFKILGLKYGLDPRQAAQVDTIAKLAVTGGLRATVDPFYQTTFTRSMVRAFNEGGTQAYARTLLNLPFAIVEQSMRPITEFLVPRQKLGVFAQLAMHAVDQLGPGATHDQVREAMAKAADSTENRMGQMTYDNLFYNKVVKDTALVGFRAYGWQLGKYREMLGAAADTTAQAVKAARGQRPELTARMAYAVALPMVVGAIGGMTNYLMTGQRPQGAMDYFFPRNGQTGTDGRPQRLMLPSYLKDLVSDWHDFPNLAKMGESFYHKLNPLVGTAVDLLRNRDFYDVEIRHDDDPAWKQQLDNVKYVLKSATPFAVTGGLRLHEQGAGAGQFALPFFGVVPAKKALTMTPAEAKAADLMQDTYAAGTRTQAQFDHSQMVKQLANDLRNDPVKGRTAMAAAMAAGKLHANDPNTIATMLTLTPLQYQVKKLDPNAGMRVWDLANPAERAQIRDILLMRVSASKTLDDDTRGQYLRVLTGAKPLPAPVETSP